MDFLNFFRFSGFYDGVSFFRNIWFCGGMLDILKYSFLGIRENVG